MLTQEAVLDYTCDYLESEHFEISQTGKGHDVIAKKEGKTLKIVGKGAVADASSTSKSGKEYNKNQVRTNLSLAMYAVSKSMTEDAETENAENFEYGIALPQTKHYVKAVDAVKVVLKQLGIHVYIVSELGEVFQK